MRNFIIYILLLISTASFSQIKREIKIVGKDTIIDIGGEEIEIDSSYVQPNLFVRNLEKLDTIYVYFKYGENEEVKLSGIQSPDYKSLAFIFNFKNGKQYRFIKGNYLRFGFDKELPNVNIKSKRFLRKNKNSILTYKNLDKNTEQLRNIYFSIKYKPIYLIDCKETKRGKITLRQVDFFGDYYPKE